MNYVKGREHLSDGITVNMLELRLLLGKVVLSFRSGGGETLTRWLNEVRRKNKRNKYIMANTQITTNH